MVSCQGSFQSWCKGNHSSGEKLLNSAIYFLYLKYQQKLKMCAKCYNHYPLLQNLTVICSFLSEILRPLFSHWLMLNLVPISLSLIIKKQRMPGNKQKYFLTQQQCNLEHCPGFSWGKVDFLSSNCHSALAWIQDENGVDNMGMFWLLLHEVKEGLFCFSHHTTSKQVRGHKRLGGDTIAQADLKWQREHSTPQSVMLSV